MDVFDFIQKVIRKLMHLFWGLIYSGYASHLAVGILIGACISIYTWKRTSSKIRAILLGLTIATTIGFLKEIVDPYIGRSRDLMDLVYTVLGGLFGSIIVLSERVVAKFDLK